MSSNSDKEDQGQIEPTERIAPSRVGDPLPERVGPYKILEILGEGGMGVVYLAEQTRPIRRRVALKLIKLGMDSKQVIARFESERQALAMMDHPGVAKVFDAGVSKKGRLYFVMELVHGLAITEHCDRHKLGIDERLGLFIQTCKAVQHAHQKGIIHRDIKPTNILVEYADGQATPKIIDFGVAKATSQRLTDKTLFTEQGQLIGTPAYMSPEQADLSVQDIDTRSDIYSLGVLLYELLTGTLPFDPKSLRRGGFAEIQRITREVEPRKPSTRISKSSVRPDGQDDSDTSTSIEIVAKQRRSDPRALVKRIRGDLDWIVMKCLEKDRARRYDTANGLALDIHRHLSNEAVLASPPTARYRLSKFVRRNKGPVGAAGVIALILVSATVVSVNFARREADQRRIAVAAEREQNRARKEAEQARDNLETVTEFQQSMLGDIDAEKMGRGIITAQRDSIRDRLETDGATPEEVETALASFDALAGKINATTLALKVVDENVLSRSVETIHEEFANQPLVRAALEQTVAGTYREIGLYERAMPLQQAALTSRRDELGDDHPDTLSSINDMGLLLKAMGKYEEALPYYREAQQGFRRVLGDDHPNTLVSIGNLGLALQAIGKNEEALPYLREALVGRRRVLGDDHPNTLGSITNMGGLLNAMGKNKEALLYFREALDGKRRVLGDDHPGTLLSINNMGFLLQAMGKNEEALPYYREALEGRRRVLGDDNPDTLTSINNMGTLLQAQGKLSEAEPYAREVLEGIRRVQGDNHPQTLISIHNMARLMRDLGRLEEAETLGAEAVGGAKEKLSPSHPFRLAAMTEYGHTLAALERYPDAEGYLLEAYEGFANTLGAEHRRTIKTINFLIDLYDAWHAAEPAKDYAAKAAEWRARLPEENGE